MMEYERYAHLLAAGVVAMSGKTVRGKAVTIMDGGMGRELERRGAPFRQPEWSALAMMDAPEIVQDVHSDFIDSGAQVILTNSYALVPFHIGEARFTCDAERLAGRSGQVARAATSQAVAKVQVAGAIPPLFGSYRADLYQPDQAARIATPLITGLLPHVDCWILETQSLIQEAVDVCGLLRQLDSDTKPVWVAFSLDDRADNKSDVQPPRLRSGESVEDAIRAVISAEVASIQFNCCQPEVIEAALIVARNTLQQLGRNDVELGAYANAFPPQQADAAANDNLNAMRGDLDPQAYLEWAQRWHAQGATLIGGCCGIGPAHIAVLSSYFSPSSTGPV